LKIDRFIKEISDRLDDISNGNYDDGGSNDDDRYKMDKYDDEYYLDIGQDPPRFRYYRQARAEKWNALAHEHKPSDTDPSITVDEIEYGLKRALRVPREQRYQYKKYHWYWHESSYYKRGLEAYDGKGCNGFTGCIPECKFFPEFGVIEDEEVREDFREATEYFRQRNAIVEPPSESELLEMAKKEMT
jgi:hypothetical protein